MKEWRMLFILTISLAIVFGGADGAADAGAAAQFAVHPHNTLMDYRNLLIWCQLRDSIFTILKSATFDLSFDERPTQGLGLASFQNCRGALLFSFDKHLDDMTSRFRISSLSPVRVYRRGSTIRRGVELEDVAELLNEKVEAADVSKFVDEIEKMLEVIRYEVVWNQNNRSGVVRVFLRASGFAFEHPFSAQRNNSGDWDVYTGMQPSRLNYIV